MLLLSGSAVLLYKHRKPSQICTIAVMMAGLKCTHHRSPMFCSGRHRQINEYCIIWILVCGYFDILYMLCVQNVAEGPCYRFY